MFWNEPEIRRLVGNENAPLVKFMQYDEERGTRNYTIDLRPDRLMLVNAEGDGPWYQVHIDSPTSADVTVVVTADWRTNGLGGEQIGSFTLKADHYPSPVSRDPVALQKAFEVILADLRGALGRRRPKA